MKTLEAGMRLFEGLTEKTQGILSRRNTLSLALAGSVSGAALVACGPPIDIDPQCQDAYDDCHLDYLNCINSTPAGKQEQLCEPIGDFCLNNAKDCTENVNASTGDTSDGGLTENVPTGGNPEAATEATSGDQLTSGGGSGGGGGNMSEGGSTGADSEYCPAPHCAESECAPGEIGSICNTEINGDEYIGIVGCDGDCYIHHGVNFDENGDGIPNDPNYNEASWCDDYCDDYSDPLGYNKFNCTPFYSDGGACEEPKPSEEHRV